MGNRELNLDGGEISVIKALGTGGGEVRGDDLISRVSDLDAAEIIDTLKGLIMLGYVSADDKAFHSLKDMEKVHFHVNSGYAKDLKEAIDPQPEQRKSKRVRRE